MTYDIKAAWRSAISADCGEGAYRVSTAEKEKMVKAQIGEANQAYQQVLDKGGSIEDAIVARDEVLEKGRQAAKMINLSIGHEMGPGFDRYVAMNRSFGQQVDYSIRTRGESNQHMAANIAYALENQKGLRPASPLSLHSELTAAWMQACAMGSEGQKKVTDGELDDIIASVMCKVDDICANVAAQGGSEEDVSAARLEALQRVFGTAKSLWSKLDYDMNVTIPYEESHHGQTNTELRALTDHNRAAAKKLMQFISEAIGF